jgi:hypothetical protein
VRVLDARSLDPVRTPMASGSGVVQEIENSQDSERPVSEGRKLASDLL